MVLWEWLTRNQDYHDPFGNHLYLIESWLKHWLDLLSIPYATVRMAASLNVWKAASKGEKVPPLRNLESAPHIRFRSAQNGGA